MPYPAVVIVGIVLPGVNAQLTPALAVRGPHPHLNRDRVPLAQHQRRDERELRHHIAADLVARPHGQLQESGAGEHHDPAHGVIGQPRMRPQ
ncbi:hypothetical protein GCM10009556_038260 [Acrocarpospora pleiomorpha]